MLSMSPRRRRRRRGASTPLFGAPKTRMMEETAERPGLVNYLVSAGMMLVLVVLIFLQPDMATAAVLVSMWLAMVFESDMPVRYMILTALLGLAGLYPMWRLTELLGFEYMQDRVLGFFNPEPDYQVGQALIAIGSGELWGKGLGQGTQSQLRYLPARHTDFIFAVTAEELGYAGIMLLFLLYAVLFYRLLRAILLASDTYGRLLATGVLAMILFQFVINIGMNLYGGGFFFYGITLVLTGIGIYVYGLFSRQLLTWSGAMQILLGLVMIALSPDMNSQKWVAACAFGIGFPAFALMVDRTVERSVARELLLSLGWLALVLVPAFAAASISQDSRFETWPHVSWSGYLQQVGEEGAESIVVKLPAGTHVPVSMKIDGDLLQPIAQPPPLILRTTRAAELAVERGEVMGISHGDGKWNSRYDYRIKKWDIRGRLSPTEGPTIDLSFQVLLER